jgi:ATP-binding cassette subfamily F protein 3
MRIALAKLLLGQPSVLILDEPSNHLDVSAKKWLGNYLSTYAGTVVMVSHDVDLLKKSISSIAEVRHNKIELYKSRSYDQWLIEREEREKAAVNEYERGVQEIARLQVYIHILHTIYKFFQFYYMRV